MAADRESAGGAKPNESTGASEEEKKKEDKN